MTEKLKCYSHKNQTSSIKEKLQELTMQKQKLLLEKDRILVKQIWDNFAEISSHSRAICLDGIVEACCFPQLSYLSNKLTKLTKFDFITILPQEISFKILKYLDATSLCRISQVCSAWKKVADCDDVWKHMCSQHIDKKCTKCGWGLPLMFSKRIEAAESNERVSKRIKLSPNDAEDPVDAKSYNIVPLQEPVLAPVTKTVYKPWKQVYAERLVVARNWRMSKCSKKDLIGHTDSVMSVYYDESLNLLISASQDSVLRAWDISTGLCKAILKGHTDIVRMVQFDSSKIISCSMDKTIRIWCANSFNCVRVIELPTDGVVCIHFVDKILASGSVNGAIRVWDLGKGCSFSLIGHNDWVNKIRVLPSKTELLSCSDDTNMILWDIYTRSPLRTFSGHTGPIQSLQLLKPSHDPASKHLRRIVTGSLDNTLRIWDFKTGELLDTLFGHSNGVWTVDADAMRIVSGSQDNTVKIWDIESKKCVYTFQQGCPVRAVWISDTKLITAGENGLITIRDFLDR